jgi:hypothetical protein
MRIFLFGSIYGLISSLILGKKELTVKHADYRADKSTQLFGLIGTIFVWILLPWISTIDQGQAAISYIQIAPLNIWYALSASAATSFAVSILIHGKISVHDVIFSSFVVKIYLNFRVQLVMDLLPVLCQILSHQF